MIILQIDVEVKYKALFSEVEENRSNKRRNKRDHHHRRRGEGYKKIFGIQGIDLCTILNLLNTFSSIVGFIIDIIGALFGGIAFQTCPIQGQIEINNLPTDLTETVVAYALYFLNVQYGYYEITARAYNNDDKNIATAILYMTYSNVTVPNPHENHHHENERRRGGRRG